jgi:hypothetical protein
MGLKKYVDEDIMSKDELKELRKKEGHHNYLVILNRQKYNNNLEYKEYKKEKMRIYSRNKTLERLKSIKELSKTLD